MTKKELWQSIQQAEPELAEFVAMFSARIISHQVDGTYLIDSDAGKEHRALVAKNQARIEADRKVERNHFRLVKPRQF